jgi:lipoyl(octanoyl) transferase
MATASTMEAVVDQQLWVVDLGTVEYRVALALQERVRAARQQDAIPDVLLLLEHPPVYTRGRRTGAGELPFAEDWYRERGIDIVDVKRGGRVTYHGPGQLVGYPIMRTTDVLEFVRTMERSIVASLAGEGVEARQRTDEGPDYTGVWIGERKIASIGVHVVKGVTAHGFAINIVNDLSPFGWVVACGLPDVAMTSVARELNAGAPAGDQDLFERIRAQTSQRFAEAHGRTITEVSSDSLEAAVAPLLASMS